MQQSHQSRNTYAEFLETMWTANDLRQEANIVNMNYSYDMCNKYRTKKKNYHAPHIMKS